MQKALFVALAGFAVVAAPQRADARQDDPAVQLTLNKRQPFVRGQRVRAFVETRDDGYLLVLHAEPTGRIRVLFPVDPYLDDFVRGGRRTEIRSRGDREAFRVLEREGTGTVFAAFSRDPLNLGAFIRQDHWDYRALDEWRLTRDRDPEAELVALAQEITGQAFFEYDLLHYGVGREYAAYGYRPGRVWVGYGWAPSVRVGFGPFHVGYYTRPYRRWSSLHFCDPFFYDAWSCSLAWDRYWWSYDPWYSYDHWYARGYWAGDIWARDVWYQNAWYRGYDQAYRDGRARYVYNEVLRGPSNRGGRYSFKNDAQTGLTGGIGMRRRVPETQRVADNTARRTTTDAARADARAVQARSRRAVYEAPQRTARDLEQARPTGWGMTDGRRVVPTSRNADAAGRDDAAARRTTDAARRDATPATEPSFDFECALCLNQPESERATRRPGTVRPVEIYERTEDTPRRATTAPSSARQQDPAPRRATPSVQRAPSRATSPARRAARQPSSVTRQPSAVTRQPARSSGSTARQAPRPTARPQVNRPSVSRRPSTPSVRRSTPPRTTRRPKPAARRP